MKLSINLITLIGSCFCVNSVLGQEKYLGDFRNYNHEIFGRIHSKGENQLVIKEFEYDGTGPDPFFWVSSKGTKPNREGTILPHPFEGMFSRFINFL